MAEFDFADNTICHPSCDGEYDVIQHFAQHASRYPRCEDPYRVHIKGGTLCERGHVYAGDVVRYVYSKAGKAYSIVDRCPTTTQVQIEILPYESCLRQDLVADYCA
jgi:hypothetical protein